ncbi:unnamed protein product [Candidula unifasciata]|uniref:Methionine adenosyltransferase 2 subunit beta n=1 Tax=Candidula unifasciata TaxID=100452 RepID=A0A8S3ZX18_9EUPU|nr:unnamed protein product [Candidula unifasciata]
MAKRILITGASGLLGRAFLATFSADSEWETLGLAFSRAGDRLKKVDLTDPDQVAAVVREFKVYTDYVFDGTKPPYKPGDKPSPLNKYGLSKAAGEKVVTESSPGNIVLRVPILYGMVENLDESAVTMLFSKVKDVGKPAEMNHYERRYPTLCSDVADAVRVLVNSRVKSADLTGIFHWSGDEMMTKYNMAVTMAELFGIPTQHIIADTKPATGAPRPFDCHLDCSRMEELGATKRTPFKVGIKPVLERFYP